MKETLRTVWEWTRGKTFAALERLEWKPAPPKPAPVLVARREKMHLPLYDTWCSWRNGLDRMNLFNGDTCGNLELTNFTGYGCFSEGQRFTIRGVSVQVEASAQELTDALMRGAHIELRIADRRYGAWTAEYLLRAAGGYLVLPRTISLPERQNFYVVLTLGEDALRILRGAVGARGPGYGWARVKVTLDGLLEREAR